MLMLFSIGQWSASNFNNIVIFFFLIKSMLYIYIYNIVRTFQGSGTGVPEDINEVGEKIGGDSDREAWSDAG
jgi:hypothetical protein